MGRRLLIIALLMINLVIAMGVEAGEVPRYLNYQSVLFDSGGNPIPDGTTKLLIRILDANMDIVYEEVQQVDAVSGVVSVMVGAGTGPASGAPTGGINTDTLLPEGPRYLDVQAEGYPAENPMELVSVPYSRYADVAMGVANGVVGSEQIKKTSIMMEHLTDDLVSQIEEKIAGGDDRTVVIREEFDGYKDTIKGSSGAGEVGVRPDFIYSSSENIQGVLKDFDVAIKKRSEDARKVDENNFDLDGGDTMRGNMNMGGNRIIGLATPNIGSDAATKGYVDNHINNTSNPHGVTTEQIGAARASDLGNHINNTSNPHGVTTEQIGAARASDLGNYVSNSDLYNPDTGRIKIDKLPDEVITSSSALPEVGHGRFAMIGGNWRIDGANTNNTCSILSGEEEWAIECIYESHEFAIGQPAACSINDEIIPLFQFNITGLRVVGPGGMMGANSITSNFVKNIRIRQNQQRNANICEKYIWFSLGKIAIYDTGSVVTWQFYRRLVNQ